MMIILAIWSHRCYEKSDKIVALGIAVPVLRYAIYVSYTVAISEVSSCFYEYTLIDSIMYGVGITVNIVMILIFSFIEHRSNIYVQAYTFYTYVPITVACCVDTNQLALMGSSVFGLDITRAKISKSHTSLLFSIILSGSIISILPHMIIHILLVGNTEVGSQAGIFITDVVSWIHVLYVAITMKDRLVHHEEVAIPRITDC
jgi:hypothetical protein